MATAKSTMMAESQEIQRRMAQVRRDLHQEAQQVVRGAQSMTDWKGMVKAHPWLALGISATVGYFIVPSRRVAAAPTIVTLPAVHHSAEPLVTAGAEKSNPPEKRSRWGVLGTVFSLVAPIAVRAAQNYAMNYVEQMLAGQTMMPPAEAVSDPRTRLRSSDGKDAARSGRKSV